MLAQPEISFERISRRARPYPANLLPLGGTALALFAAGFHGWNDVIHMVRKDMRVTCVDTDEQKLRQMHTIYPREWAFRARDAWEWAEECVELRQMYDVVSVDPFFEDAAVKAWAALDLWASLARNLVTLTVHADTELTIPDGWRDSYFPRGHDVGWLVLQR